MKQTARDAQGSVQSRGSERISGAPPSRELALRTHPLVFGVVMFLASDLMIFGGFIAAYFNLRSQTDAWPPPGVTLDVVSAAIGTAMLAVSSGTMMFATHYLARNDFARSRMWVGATMLLGTAFVLLSFHSWSKDTFHVNTHAYGSLYYTMTGFHVFHVSAGVLLLLILFGNMHKAAFQRDERAGGEAIGFFWHFVFIIWVLIWGSIYVIK